MLPIHRDRARACVAALAAVAGALFTFALPARVAGQSAHAARARAMPSRDTALTDLLARAVSVSPRLRAARASVDASRARVSPAGTRPDPMLMAGVQNLPVREPGFGDEMTMKMVGVSQIIPLWGKLRLARTAAEREVVAAAAEVVAESLAVRAEATSAYFEIAFANRALEILERSRLVLLDLARVAEVRYGIGDATGTMSPPATPASSAPNPSPPASTSSRLGGSPPSSAASMSGMSGMSGVSGTGGASGSSGPASRTASSAPMIPVTVPGGEAGMSDGMAPSGMTTIAGASMGAAGRGGLQDVIRARLAVVRLGEQAVAVREQRAAALARLNALLDRPGDTPVEGASIPERIHRAAVATSAARVRFESAAFGSRAADSPLPPLPELQAVAIAESPALRAHEAMLAAQGVRVALARRERRPDVDVSLEYGQRDRMPDMVTARVSVPLPVQRGRRQDQVVAEARANLARLEAEHLDRIAQLHAEVARLHGAAERDRAQLALYVKAVLPQGRAVVEATLASFRVGRVGLAAVLEAQSALFEYETTYHRALTDFAKTLAALEQVVGREVLHD